MQVSCQSAELEISSNEISRLRVYLIIFNSYVFNEGQRLVLPLRIRDIKHCSRHWTQASARSFKQSQNHFRNQRTLNFPCHVLRVWDGNGYPEQDVSCFLQYSSHVTCLNCGKFSDMCNKL